MTFCDKKLRYFTLKNDYSYKMYLDNDEKCLLFAAKYCLGNHKSLYKYPRSLAKCHNYFSHKEGNVNEFISKLYSDPNDIVDYALKSYYNILDITIIDLSKVTPKRIMKLVQSKYEIPSDWFKYIIDDIEMVFEVVSGYLYEKVSQECLDMITDDMWDTLRNDSRFAWRRITKENYTYPRSAHGRVLDDNELHELSSHPKYLSEYVNSITFMYEDGIPPDYFRYIFDILIEYPKYATRLIYKLQTYHATMNMKVLDELHEFIEGLIIKYYNKYENNMRALPLLLSEIREPKKSKHIFDKVREKMIENRIINAFNVDSYIADSSYDEFVHDLMGISYHIYKYDNSKVLEYDKEYIGILMGSIHIDMNRWKQEFDVYKKYKQEYADIINKYEEQYMRIHLEIFPRKEEK